MGTAIVDNLNQVFESGASMGIASDSIDSVADSVTQVNEKALELKSGIESGTVSSVIEDITASVTELQGLAPEEVQSQMGEMLSVLSDLVALNNSLNGTLADGEPLSKVLNSAIMEGVNKAKESQRVAKVIEAWNNFVDLYKGYTNTYRSSVDLYENNIEIFKESNQPGNYIEDILKNDYNIYNAYQSFRSNVVALCDVVLAHTKGGSDVEQRIRANIAHILEILPVDLVEAPQEADGFRYGVHGILLMCQTAQSKRVKLLKLLPYLQSKTKNILFQRSITPVVETLTNWIGLWDDVVLKCEAIGIREYKKDAVNREVATELLAVHSVTSEIIANGVLAWEEFFKYSTQLLSESDNKELDSYFSVFKTWDQVLDTFTDPVESFVKGRDLVNRRRVYLKVSEKNLDIYRSVYTDADKMDGEGSTDPVEGASGIPSKSDSCSSITNDLIPVTDCYKADRNTGDFSTDFKQTKKLLDDILDAYNKMTQCAGLLYQLCDSLGLTKCCGCCKAIEMKCNAGKISCNSLLDLCLGLDALCSGLCVACSALGSMLDALLSMLNTALSNVLSHGFKFHQGDVIIDGNLIVTKDVMILKNLFVQKNAVIAENLAVKQFEVVGIESIVGGMPVMSNLIQLWAVKMDK